MNGSARIAYAWEWGTGTGHLGRFEVLARELVRENHKITLTVRDLTLARKIFPLGQWGTSIDVRQAPTPIDKPPVQRHRPTTFAELAWNLGYFDRDRTLASIEAWRGVLADTQCDCVIADFGIGSVIAAKSIGLPVIRLGTGFECPPQNSPLTQLELPYQSNDDTAMDTLNQLRNYVDDAVALLSKQRATDSYIPSLESVPQIVASLPELEHYRVARPNNTYIGAWGISKPPAIALPNSNGNRVCFAYLKKSRHVERLLKGLNRRGYEIVLAGPAARMKLSYRDGFQKVHRCNQMIDIKKLSPRISFGITNANHGTTTELLGNGVPVLAIPLFVEQQVTAHNLTRHRLGTSLTSDSDADLDRAIAELELSAIQDRCHELARRNELEYPNPSVVAAQRLRSWLAEHC